MKRQEAQSTRKTSLGSLDPIEKAVVAKFTKQIGNIEEVLSMHDAPDAPVWAANCSYGTEIILAWNRAKRAVMYEIRSEDADWGEEGYVWQGTSTMITLPARTRSETFYIKSINAAGMYSEQASSITLENEAPSAPVFTLVSSTSGFTVLLSDTESDVVKVVLSITEVDEQQKPLGETVQRVCEEKTYFFAAEPRTSWKVSVVAYDSIGAGEESAAKYVTVSGIDAWHIIDIPEHIVSPSHLTESLMEEIESAVDGVDYLDRQMSEAQQRLSQAESELGSIDGRVTYTETKITELEGEIATKVSQTDYNTLVGRVETAETNITQNAQAIATKASQSSVDTLEGRVSTAETTITQQAQEIASKASQSSVDTLEGRVSAAESTITQHGNAISSVVSEVESIDGRVETAESAITQLGSEITLKVQVRQDGKLVIAGIGMAVDEDGQSEVAVLADRFRVLTRVDGEMKSVFAVDTETGKVYVLGDLIATGLIRATEVQAEVAKHLLLAAEVATVDHLGALKIEAGAITVGGEAPGISLTKPEGGKLWHFDGSLVSTDGTAPESGAVATLRPDGRFGGAVAVEEETTNLANNPTFSGAVGTRPSGWNSDVTIQQDDFFGQLINVAELLCVSGDEYEDFGTGIAYPLAYNTTYTISFWARGTMEINYGLSTSRGIASATWKSKPPMSLQWQRYEVTIVTASSGSIYPFWWYLYNPNDVNVGKWVRIARIQLEQKPFATSFVDGTRAEGRLRYPQLLDKKRGTLSVWINPHVVVNWNQFFSMNLSTGRFLLFFYADGSSRWDFGPNNSGPRTPASTIVAGQWAMHTLTWDADAGVYRYYVNGEFVGECQYVEPDSLPPVLPTVNNYGALIDELLILPYAATPEQIQAWYAMGAPFHDPQERIGDERIPSASRWDAGIAEALSELADLSSEVSAKVTIFYQPNQPTAKAIGDIWYDTDADPVAIHRWNGSQWIDITTTALSAALAAAGDAQATADGKIMTFAQASAPQATAIGDLWVDTSDDNKLYRWSGSAWVSVQDTHNDAAIASHASQISSLTTAVNSKITIFYQPEQPTANVTGDIWYDTDADPVAIHRWNGSQWIDITTTALSAALAAAGDAQATADGKIKTYYQASAPTTGMSIGDLWVDTDDGNRLYRYSGTQWVDVADKTPIDADERPISAASGQVYIGESGIAVANGAMIFVSGTFSHDQLGRLITAAVDRPLTTDPGGQKSVSAPVEISAARGVEIYKGKLNVWADTGGAGDKRYIHDGRVTDDGIIGMDALKLAGTVAMENLPGHLIRTAPGVSGAVMYYARTPVVELGPKATMQLTFTTAMPYVPEFFVLDRRGRGSLLEFDNVSKTGFRITNTHENEWIRPYMNVSFFWIALCASHDPSTSSCDNCQEECQGECQQGRCQDSCQTGECQLTCESDCKTTCEGACQDACMFSCQLPPPLGLWY